MSFSPQKLNYKSNPCITHSEFIFTKNSGRNVLFLWSFSLQTCYPLVFLMNYKSVFKKCLQREKLEVNINYFPETL